MKKSMAKKKGRVPGDRRLIEEDCIVFCDQLSELTHCLTGVWNVYREYREDESRLLTEREVIHLRAALYMVKEIHEEISWIAQAYNASIQDDTNVLKFNTGSISVQDRKPKEIK